MNDDIQDAEIVGQQIEVSRPLNSTLATQDEMSIDQLVAQVQKIQEAMQRVMKQDVHFGTIPGTNKPTLYKPGAEKLCLLFRLAPEYQMAETFHEDDHYTVRAVCRLVHSPTGNLVASGEGLCSSKESSYAYRKASRACPDCGNAETLKKSKQKGQGWYCWAKIGGCGSTFAEDDVKVTSQALGRVDNPDIPDLWNTVLKMAAKRALIAAVLNGTAASDIFTQDLETHDQEQRQVLGQDADLTQPEETQAASEPAPQPSEGSGQSHVPASAPDAPTEIQKQELIQRITSAVEEGLIKKTDMVRKAGKYVAKENCETVANCSQLHRLSAESIVALADELKLPEVLPV